MPAAAWIMLAALLAVAAGAVVLALWYRHRTRETMVTLGHMLDLSLIHI